MFDTEKNYMIELQKLKTLKKIFFEENHLYSLYEGFSRAIIM